MANVLFFEIFWGFFLKGVLFEGHGELVERAALISILLGPIGVKREIWHPKIIEEVCVISILLVSREGLILFLTEDFRTFKLIKPRNHLIRSIPFFVFELLGWGRLFLLQRLQNHLLLETAPFVAGVSWVSSDEH